MASAVFGLTEHLHMVSRSMRTAVLTKSVVVFCVFFFFLSLGVLVCHDVSQTPVWARPLEVGGGKEKYECKYSTTWDRQQLMLRRSRGCGLCAFLL